LDFLSFDGSLRRWTLSRTAQHGLLRVD